MYVYIIIIVIALVAIVVLGWRNTRLVAERDLERMKLKMTKDAYDEQIATLKHMNTEQMKSQLELIREQMQTTSEKVLKQRQSELGIENQEQVSKIIDPLQKSLKDMQEALNKTKEQQ